MHIVIIILLVQLALVVHAMKTGRDTVWVFILLLFPLVGGLAYVIVELLPGLTSSRPARKAKQTVTNAINPEKQLQAASQRLEVADTVQNAMNLAQECIAQSRFAEAKDLYARCMKGVHADDPALLLGLATAEFKLGEYQNAVDTLELLRERNPGIRSPEGHLMYARSLEALGDIRAAMDEYHALAGYYPGPEPACRLAMHMKAHGQEEEAIGMFVRIVNESRIAGKHYNELHKEWVEQARRESDLRVV